MPGRFTASSVEHSVDAQFLDILVSDAEFLRAEFDAIIATEWPDPPAPVSRRRPARNWPAPQHRGRWPTDQSAPVQVSSLGGEAWRRQRSPPA